MHTRTCTMIFAAAVLSCGPALADSASTAVAVHFDKSTTDYRSGFRDGCVHGTSGNEIDTVNNTSELYRVGWRDGYSDCRYHGVVQNTGDPNGPLKNLF